MAGAGNGEQSGEKIVAPAALKRSVQETPEQTTTFPSIGLDTSLLWFVAAAASEIEPWGRRTKLRDKQLRDFFPTESMFSSALGVVTARNIGFDWVIDGPERTTAHIHQILEDADQGAGWESLVAKLSEDLYTQDHGAFMEIVRATDSADGALLAINHLDAARCWPTGDPLRPVIYLDRLSKYHLLNWWQVVQMLEMPAPIETKPGLQVCALSRLLLAVQIIKNIAIYKHEKTGGRHNRAIHLVQGVTAQAIADAIEQAKLVADQRGALRYVNPLIVGSHDPKAVVDVKTLEIASLPDGFDEEKTFKHYIAQIAMAFLADYQDFAPLPGGGLGTSTQSEILHMKSRGRGPALWMKLITHAMQQRVLPKAVEFRFEEQDLGAEQAEAETRLARAEGWKVLVEAGILSSEEARQLMLDAGDLPLEMFEAEDVTGPAPQAQHRQGEQPDAEPEERVEEGEREVSPILPFGDDGGVAGTKQERAGPFEDDRLRAERRLERAIRKAFEKIRRNTWKQLRKESRGQKALTDVPEDAEFWGAQRAEFMAEVGAEPLELVMEGAAQAERLGLAVDFDLVNRQVLDLAGEFRNEWWEQLERSSRDSLRTAVQAHIESGAPLGQLEKQLEPIFGKVRGQVIARTEVTRLYAEGNRQAYANAGIQMVEWRTVADALVDPICSDLDGKQMRLGQEEEVPPAHPRCRCWLAPVVEGKPIQDIPKDDLALIEDASVEEIGEAFERWATESGQMIEILEGGTPTLSSYGSRYTADQLRMMERQAKLINALANQSRTERLLMYRGESYATREEILNLYRMGDKVSRDRLLSMTPDAKVAETYAGMEHPQQVVLQFTSPEGHQGTWADIASRWDQVRAADAGSEFILANGATYEVVGVIEPSKGTPFWQIFLQP